MAFVHSKNSVVKLNNVALTSFVKNTTFSPSADTHDTTVYGQGGHAFAAGLTNGKVTLSGMYDDGASNTPRTVITALIGGAAVTLLWQPEGAGSGFAQASAQVIVESYDETSPVADFISWSSSLQISGTVNYTDQTA